VSRLFLFLFFAPQALFKSSHLFVDVDDTKAACIERKKIGKEEEEREKGTG
jgi:hypothetical protein